MQSLVHVHVARGDEKMALSVAREAVAVFRELGNKSLEASMLTEVAKLHSMGGQLEEARRVADEAALLYRDTGDFVGQAGAMRIMGAVEDAKVTQAKRFEEEAESQALLTKLRDAVVERDAVVFKATLQEIYDNPYVNLDMAQELLQPLVDKDDIYVYIYIYVYMYVYIYIYIYRYIYIYIYIYTYEKGCLWCRDCWHIL